MSTSEIASLQSTLFTTQRDLDQCLEASKSLQAREWQLQARLSELERERQEISMALGNQREEVISTTELVENIERITRIAGKGVLRIGELERENARLRDKLEHLLSIDKQHDRTPRIIDLCYTAFMRAHAKNDEDGGPTDWFTDTYPMIVKAIEKHRAAALEERET